MWGAGTLVIRTILGSGPSVLGLSVRVDLVLAWPGGLSGSGQKGTRAYSGSLTLCYCFPMCTSGFCQNRSRGGLGLREPREKLA